MEIGIDLGGTKIAGGLVKNGKIIKRVTVPTFASKGRATVLKQLQSVIDDLSKGVTISGVGIGVPGLNNGTKLEHLSNIPCLDGVDLKKVLRGNVAVENDAKAFALGEWRFGAGKKSRCMIGLILGTGVGSGIVVDGKVFRGAHNFAGEVGHMLYDLSAKSSDIQSHWEWLLSGPGMVRRHKARGGREADPAAIWRSTSKQSKQTREETIQLLAVFIRSLQRAFDPNVIVLGGGVSNLPIDKEVNKFLPNLGCDPIVRKNKLGIDAAILGAVAALSSRP